MEISKNSDSSNTNVEDIRNLVGSSSIGNALVIDDALSFGTSSQSLPFDSTTIRSYSHYEDGVHLPTESKFKKRELPEEMESNLDEKSCKVSKLWDYDTTANNSIVDGSNLELKQNDSVRVKNENETNNLPSIDDSKQMITDNVESENTVAKELEDYTQTRGIQKLNDNVQSAVGNEKSQSESSLSLPSSPALLPSSCKSSEEKANSSSLNCETDETTTSELIDENSSIETSSCDSSSSSSDLISMISSFEEEEEDDDDFGLEFNERNMSSGDEQNSEDNEDQWPSVLKKTLPIDKFSFPKEIMLRQIHSGDCKQRWYSKFDHKIYASRGMVQRLQLYKSLKKHNGAVNTINFNGTGNILISGSDDRHVSLWNWAENKNLLHFNSGHCANVFQAKFLPFSNDTTLITCGQDSQVRKCLLDECGLKSTSLLVKHDRAVHKITMQPQMPNSFLTAGEDGVVYSIDIRERNKFCSKLLKVRGHRSNPSAAVCLYSIQCNPIKNYEFIVSGNCDQILLYDQRNISSKQQKPVKQFSVGYDLTSRGEGRLASVTCAVYNHNGTEILASYNDNDVFLFNSSDPSRYVFRYDGHRNFVTIKGVNFFGPQSEYVVSGSDCGYIYIWDKKSESIVQWMKGDKDIVNCLEPHPSFPILATSGIESDVKVWMPLSEECDDVINKKEFRKIVKKNLYFKRDAFSRVESEFFLFSG